jgi:callose synthase
MNDDAVSGGDTGDGGSSSSSNGDCDHHLWISLPPPCGGVGCGLDCRCRVLVSCERSLDVCARERTHIYDMNIHHRSPCVRFAKMGGSGAVVVGRQTSSSPCLFRPIASSVACRGEKTDCVLTVCANKNFPFCRNACHLFALCTVEIYRNRRLYSGFLSAGCAGFLIFTYLQPLFVPVGSDTAMVFLYILSLYGSAVGMSLGVLLPLLFPGASLGAALALFGAAASGVWDPYLFPVAAGISALPLSIVAARYVPSSSVCVCVCARGESRPCFPFPSCLKSYDSQCFCCSSFSFDSHVILSYATAVEGGAVSSCFVMKSMFPYLMDVARGYPYFPPTGNGDEHEVLGFNGFTTRQELLLAFIWAASALLVAATIAYRDGHFANLNLAYSFRSGYTPVPSHDPSARSQKRIPSLPPLNLNPPIRNDVFNMFDPADLPPRLAEYANMVYSACEDLGNFFGFQDSSVRNQAEHLLILLSNNRRYMSSHILPPSVQPPSPIHALHAKVFSNYVKWCRAMGVPPHFSKMNTSMNAPPAVASRVVDLVLYVCVWGEGANLRHMPECVWFLYHKMMEEYVQSEGYTQTRSLYAGHFLDNVVTPIYRIVAKVRVGTARKHDLNCLI